MAVVFRPVPRAAASGASSVGMSPRNDNGSSDRGSHRGAEPPANDDPGVISGDAVLTVDEAAKLLRIGRNQLYEAIGRGDVPHARIGRTIRLSRAALLRSLGGSCEAASKTRKR